MFLAVSKVYWQQNGLKWLLKSERSGNEFLDEWRQQSEETAVRVVAWLAFWLWAFLVWRLHIKTGRVGRNDGYLPHFQAVMPPSRSKWILGSAFGAKRNLLTVFRLPKWNSRKGPEPRCSVDAGVFPVSGIKLDFKIRWLILARYERFSQKINGNF